jgi:hypothetical protein
MMGRCYTAADAKEGHVADKCENCDDCRMFQGPSTTLAEFRCNKCKVGFFQYTYEFSTMSSKDCF